MQRKEAVYKGLEFIPIYFEDTSLTSPEYFQVTEFPTKLTAGKNVFKAFWQVIFYPANF